MRKELKTLDTTHAHHGPPLRVGINQSYTRAEESSHTLLGMGNALAHTGMHQEPLSRLGLLRTLYLHV